MANRNGKSTILFIDDEQTILDVGTMMIQRSGFKVLQATNGTEAVELFQNHMDDICLVILDEILPEVCGSDICKKLKEFDPDVKVLHTSGLGKSQGDDGFECGCEAFLPKPFSVNDMSNKLEEMLADT
jgi:DNA-binding response OmpR family regulator